MRANTADAIATGRTIQSWQFTAARNMPTRREDDLLPPDPKTFPTPPTYRAARSRRERKRSPVAKVRIGPAARSGT
jgi:hypothetical protein